MKQVLHLAVALFLVGCGMHSAIPEGQSYKGHTFSFEYPLAVQYRYERSDGSVALATSKGRELAEDYFFSITDSISTPTLPLSCSPILTGTKDWTDIANIGDRTFWGKADIFEDRGLEGWDPLAVEVPGYGLVNTMDVVCQGDSPGMYALCSEKNGKTVVICLSQMTDDPKMAEEIFNTFRWLP